MWKTGNPPRKYQNWGVSDHPPPFGDRKTQGRATHWHSWSLKRENTVRTRFPSPLLTAARTIKAKNKTKTPSTAQSMSCRGFLRDFPPASLHPRAQEWEGAAGRDSSLSKPWQLLAVKVHCFPIPNHYLFIEETLPESVDSEDADLCNPFLVPMSWSRFSRCLERKFGVYFKSKKNTTLQLSTAQVVITWISIRAQSSFLELQPSLWQPLL